jgi:DNA-binding CsgD family transcriptional regulator
VSIEQGGLGWTNGAVNLGYGEEYPEGRRINGRCLAARGWTRAAINLLLGEPDVRLKRSDHPRAETLYDLSRVHAAEAKPDFHRFKQKQIRRKLRAGLMAEILRPVLRRRILDTLKAELSHRDRRILALFARGTRQRLIAKRLGISQQLVSYVVRQAAKRIGFPRDEIMLALQQMSFGEKVIPTTISITGNRVLLQLDRVREDDD